MPSSPDRQQQIPSPRLAGIAGPDQLGPILSRSRKRSSLVAGQIRSWIITQKLKPGDGLPIEKEMIERFGVSRATVREALKELEVQGLVTIKTGPHGGPTVAAGGALEAIQAIQNFCYFNDVTISDIYQLRALLEVQMAISVIGHLDEPMFEDLTLLAELSDAPAASEGDRRAQREAEFRFHTVMAQASPNPLYRLMIEVLAGILVNATARDSSSHKLHGEWSRENGRYHIDLLAAIRRGDEKAVGDLMAGHMESAHTQMTLVYGQPTMDDIALNRRDRR